MTKNIEKNRSIGIVSIIWGVLYFIYKAFFPTSVYELLGNKFLDYSHEKILKYKEMLGNLITIFDMVFIVLLIIILMVYAIFLRNEGIKLIRSRSFGLLLLALITYVIGLRGIFFIFVIIAGIKMVIGDKLDK